MKEEKQKKNKHVYSSYALFMFVFVLFIGGVAGLTNAELDQFCNVSDSFLFRNSSVWGCGEFDTDGLNVTFTNKVVVATNDTLQTITNRGASTTQDVTMNSLNLGSADDDGILNLEDGIGNDVYFQSTGYNNGLHKLLFNFGDNAPPKAAIVAKAGGGYSRGGIEMWSTSATANTKVDSGDLIARFRYDGILIGVNTLGVGGLSGNSGTKAYRFGGVAGKAGVLSKPSGSYSGGDVRFTVGRGNTPLPGVDDAVVKISQYGGVIIGNEFVDEEPTDGNIIIAGNVSIGTDISSYPLEVFGNVSNISIWAESQISATGYVTRTYKTNITDKNAYNLVKLALQTEYYANGTYNHEAWGECYAPHLQKDLTKPLYETTITVDENTGEETELIEKVGYEMIEIKGVNIDCKQVMITKYDNYLDTFLNPTEINGQLMIDTDIISAEVIYTESKVPDVDVDYCGEIMTADVFNKANHYAYKTITFDDGTNKFVLDSELRDVYTEGCAQQQLTEMCIIENGDYSWCDEICTSGKDKNYNWCKNK